ncbi:MAG: hypothetical protein DRI90_23460 [Deltaproteobacteria bacterium]|nr:MAG: hypothetical protein DRI90_23460 [Deltaproteobacteria bacterium]
MRCACGQALQPGEVVLCSACGRQNLTCSNCGAQVATAPDAVVVSCLYCNTSLQHVDLGQGTPYFTVNVADHEVGARLLTFLLNRFGIPGDFQRRFRIVEQRLVYVPVHLFRVTAWLSQWISETDFKSIIAARKVPYRKELDGYRFAMRAKIYADPRKIRGAVYEIDVSQAEAHGEAERFGRELMARDKARFDEIPTTETIQCDHQGMVYYPLYEIRYEYGSKSFQSVVDASNGVVCHADHPMSLKTRAAVKVAGLTYLALGLVAALGLAVSPATGCGQVVDPAGIGGFGGAGLVLFTALVVGGRILYTALSRSRSGEEIAASEQPLELKELTLVMPVNERKLNT